MPTPTDPYLAAVRDAGVLDPARLAEIGQWVAATTADPQSLARELTRRGWLTPFQVREVYKGNGKGLHLGPYLLLDVVGEGGMGRVYRAHHTRLQRDVALKVIRSDRLSKPVVVERFHQEIRAVAQLSHPNVVLALDADEANGTHFYAMEFVEGTDLTKLVRTHGPLPVPLACDYIRQAAIGLQHAAERGLVHRDVKPSNLLVTPRGQVKVLDLGLAMLKDAPGGDGANRVTQDGLVLGTPDFLAPEQAQNPGGVDARADVYSLGATLFYILTGRVPFPGNTPTEKLVKHVTEPAPSLLPFRPDVPPHLDAVVRWMMGKKPDDRPPTPAHAAAALVPFCAPPPAQPVAAPPSAFAPQPAFVQQPAFAAPPAFQAFAPAAPDPMAFPTAEPVAPPPEAERKEYRRKEAGGFPWGKFVLFGALLLGGGAASVGLLRVVLPKGDAVPTEGFENSLGMQMVLLPGGTFQMGSPDDEGGRDGDEGPQAEVTVSGPFFMAATEVSHAQFTTVMGRVPSKTARRSRNPGVHPVDMVTWKDAVEFCRKLSARENGRRRGWEYRLPTEAEWEYACRAGTSGPFSFGERFVQLKQVVCSIADNDPYADTDPTKTVSEQRRVSVTYPVGSTDPNPFGLHDMHGNVWEWTADYYEPYPDPEKRTDPTGPATGDWRAARGGAWDEQSNRCRSAARLGAPPDEGRPNVGFRVVFAPAREK